MNDSFVLSTKLNIHEGPHMQPRHRGGAVVSYVLLQGLQLFVVEPKSWP